MIVLECKALSKHYRDRRASVEALNQVSLQLESEEILGIAGESGSGKSTLLKLIAGLEPPSSGGIFLRGRALTQHRSKADFKAMQMVFQDAAGSFHPRRTIADSISIAVRGLLGKRAEVDLSTLSALVGLSPELMNRYPRQLSGGQCQRFAIARAMATRPEVLLCDEITSALDVSSQAQIMCLIADICRNSHMSAIFVSHDLAVIRCLCDRVVILREGGVVEQGAVADVIHRPRESYTRRLVDSVLHL